VTNLYRNTTDTEVVISSIAMHFCISTTENDNQIHIIWQLES